MRAGEIDRSFVYRSLRYNSVSVGCAPEVRGGKVTSASCFPCGVSLGNVSDGSEASVHNRLETKDKGLTYKEAEGEQLTKPLKEEESERQPGVEDLSQLYSGEDPMKIFLHGSRPRTRKREKPAKPRAGTVDGFIFVPLWYFLVAILLSALLVGLVGFLFFPRLGDLEALTASNPLAAPARIANLSEGMVRVPGSKF